jgi:hypothetical protein
LQNQFVNLENGGQNGGTVIFSDQSESEGDNTDTKDLNVGFENTATLPATARRSQRTRRPRNLFQAGQNNL